MKRVLAAALAGLTLVSLVWVAIPVVLIRPFGPQTPRGIALSYALRAWSAPLTLALLVPGCVLAVVLRKRLPPGGGGVRRRPGAGRRAGRRAGPARPRASAPPRPPPHGVPHRPPPTA